MRILCIFGLAFLLCNCSRSVVVNSPKTNTPRSLKFDWNSTNQLAQLESVVTSVNPAMVAEELNASKWDYKTELVLISCLAVLSIPANLFLIVFYTKKMRHFKKRKHFNLRYASIANSFHSYLIEICSFDTVNVVYLILNSTFHFLYFLEKSEYESVFDISNFACKFFIYILRISAAMSNYLVFLLSLNRCFLLIFRHKEDEINSHRLCLNTKYLTLFLFCLCTIANVFRLELLYLNSDSPANTHHAHNSSSNLTMRSRRSVPHNIPHELMDHTGTMGLTPADTDWILQLVQQMKDKGECGPNIRMISFLPNDVTHRTLFLSIIIYNLIFAILPAFGNLAVSVYLIRKRQELKHRLVALTLNIDKLKASVYSELALVKSFEDDESQNRPSKSSIQENGEIELCTDESACNNFLDPGLLREIMSLQLTEYEAEFLKTCSPCIAFSLTHVLLFLPYSCIDMVNQFKPYFSLIHALQYMTYARYLFYSCKFYLLFLVSYRFRRETIQFFRSLDSPFRRNQTLIDSIRNLNEPHDDLQHEDDNGNNNAELEPLPRKTDNDSKSKLNITINM